MQWCVRQLGIAAAIGSLSALGLHLLGFSPWAAPAGASLVDWAAVSLVIALAVFLDPPRLAAAPGATLRLSFIGDLTTLLFFGPVPMTLVAAVGTVLRASVNPPRSYPVRRVLLDLVSVCAATQAAGLAHAIMQGTRVPLSLPWQGVPIIGAVVAYCFITSSISDLIAPLVIGGGQADEWPRSALRGCAGYIMGAGLAVGVVELIQHRAWTLVPVAAVPLGFAWHAYRTYAEREGRHERMLDANSSQDHGVAVVDADGFVREWNDVLARLVECPANRALGRRIAEAVPVLAATELPKAVQEALSSRTPRTLAAMAYRTPSHTRMLDVTVLPDVDGVTLVWVDVTEAALAEQTTRQTAERLMLVAVGANDGIWELDVASRAVFVSPRWRDLMGIGPGDSRITEDEWFSRIAPDDVPAVKKAIEALVRGPAGRIEQPYRVLLADGTERRLICRAAAAQDGSRKGMRVAGSILDVTAIARDASGGAARDALTNLLNRASFVERLGERLEEFRSRRGGRFAALYLDLDRFKVVNDSLGHLVGDELLVEVSRRLESVLRPGDAIARLGGDEFAVMLTHIGDEMQANVVAFRLQEALQAPFPIGGREVVATASIGIAISRPEYTNPEEMMRDADTAMYQAKARGKARHELFDADMHKRAIDRLGLESDLRHAVKSSGFEVHYQPIVSLTTRMCTGFESLVRWNRNGIAVSPADFVPMAEELGIIEPLGSWVMQQACEKFMEWKARYPLSELECITVNVSARQLVQQGFIYLVEQTVERHGMRPADLRLEITETAIMDAPQFAAQVLNELRAFGVKIYLDDFGTGYSSLSHLHKLPVDALKIDRSFVRGLLMDDRPAIVESILALARTLNTNVVAEGIEDERQALELERLGCRQAQGYYFSRPLPAHAVEEMLASGKPLGGPRIPLPQPARAALVKPKAREIA